MSFFSSNVPVTFGAILMISEHTLYEVIHLGEVIEEVSSFEIHHFGAPCLLFDMFSYLTYG